MHIGKKIAVYRKLRGISQSELCRAVGLTQASISQIENGYRNPSNEKAREICDVLKIDFFSLNFKELVEDSTKGLNASQIEEVLNYIEFIKYKELIK